MRRSDVVSSLSKGGHAGDVVSYPVFVIGNIALICSEIGIMYITPTLGWSSGRYISLMWWKWSLVFDLEE